MMLGVGVEVAFYKWVVALKLHPLRWDRPDWYKNPGAFGLARLGPFSLEWDVNIL